MDRTFKRDRPRYRAVSQSWTGGKSTVKDVGAEDCTSIESWCSPGARATEQLPDYSEALPIIVEHHAWVTRWAEDAQAAVQPAGVGIPHNSSSDDCLSPRGDPDWLLPFTSGCT